MRNKAFLAACFMVLLVVLPAWGDDTPGYHKTAWTGNTAESLDGITTPADGAIAIVTGAIDSYSVTTFYVFESSSTATEAGITNIAPDDSTSGRWLQYQPAYCFGTTEPSITAGVVWFDTSE